jgi:hypothetical protein
MPEPKKPRVACLMMQRDEADLVTPWVRYHSALFGAENLYIWDNGSAVPTVMHVFDAVRGGVNVVWDKAESSHYHRKGEILGAQIAALQGKFDFFIPLDCDEFFALGTNGGVECAPDKILSALAAYEGCPSALKITEAFFNVLGHSDRFWRWPQQKTFFADGSYQGLDHGYHAGRTKNNEQIATPFVHLHYHHKPHAVMVEHAKNKLRPYVNVDDIDAVRRHEGTAIHCREPLLVSREQYEARFAHGGYVVLPNVPSYFDALGCRCPFDTRPDCL